MARRFASSGSPAGSGTLAVIGSTSCGLVPQVTCGTRLAASMTTSASKTAPSSLFSVFQ